MFATVHKLFHLLISLVFLILIGKTPNLWGFSISRVENYKKIAIDQKLWKDSQWIKLGHYEKTFTGKLKSAYRQPFFINANGFKSPKDELLSTIDALYSDSSELVKIYSQHPQCQFLARHRWLVKKLMINSEDILPCTEKRTWISDLNASKVSIIFAASDFGNTSSSFGHTFLKISSANNSKDKDLINYGVDYAARTDSSEGLLYAIKGLAGLYPGRYSMLPYHQKIREYLNLDGRDIWEYDLNFTTEEINFFIEHLLELEHAQAPYYFFTDNCSYRILKSLEVVRPDIDVANSFKSVVIPIDTVKKILRNTNWVTQTHYKKSLRTDFEQTYKYLSNQQKESFEKLVLSGQEINAQHPVDKAKILETTIKYYALEGYRSGTDYDQKKYNLSVARAELGQLNLNIPTEYPEEPHRSHDSSGIYLKYGGLENLNTNATKYYTSIKWRSALHELEQNDFGTVPLSHNETGSLELKYFTEEKKIKFDRFTVLHVVNLNPSSVLKKKLSWKVRVDFLDQWQSDLEGSMGLSYDYGILNNFRIAGLLTSRHWYLDNKPLAGIGPELLTIFHWTNRLAQSISFNYFIVNDSIDLVRTKLKMNYSINNNFDLQLMLENVSNIETQHEYSLVYNFMF